MKDLYLWAGSVNDGLPQYTVQPGTPHARPAPHRQLPPRLSPHPPPLSSGRPAAPHLAVVKSLLTQIFQPPKGHPRSKPFHDHVISFSALEGRILVRHYQVVPADKAVRGGEGSLVEIGPRFAMVPIRVLDGCFSGNSLFMNDAYVSPNVQRAELKRARARVTVGHVIQKEKRRRRIRSEGRDALPEDDLEDVFQ